MIKKMKLRKGSLTDILWLMFTLLLFVVAMRMQLEFSSVETIESYAKNTVNSEFNTFVSQITGFSTRSDRTSMFNSIGEKRLYTRTNPDPNTLVYWDSITLDESKSSIYDDSASAVGVVQAAKKQLINSILEEFNNPDSTWSYKIRSGTTGKEALPLQAEDIVVTFEEQSNSTLAHITVTYKVNLTVYDKNATTSSLEKKDGVLIKRRIKLTRAIENTKRYK